MKKKKRLSVPQKLKDKILVEFNHSCVCCGAPYHEVHHIDGDPSNNAEDNLIVLCPNCHQVRVHGKSIKITPEQLRLYKKTRSKAVFKPIYHSIKNRIGFLETNEYESLTYDGLAEKSEDLIKFVRTLRSGDYYGNKLEQCLYREAIVCDMLAQNDVDEQLKESEREYKRRIKDNKEEILRLVLECAEVQP